MDCPFDTTPKIPKVLPTMIILRGPPGAGKTTIAQTCFPDFVRCSADDHFMKNGKYVFLRAELQLAHDNCFSKTLRNLRAGTSVIVDNTFGKSTDCERYLKIPNIKIEILVVTTRFRNIHGVPQNVVDNFELEDIKIQCKACLHKVYLDLDTKKLYKTTTTNASCGI